MRKSIVALVLCAAPAFAADFRVIDLGASCTPVPELEKARGSLQVPWQPVSGAVTYAFKGQDFERALLFSYFCVDGSLFSGNYFWPIEQLDAAVTTYGEVYAKLVTDYGKPFVDNSPWQFGVVTKDSRFIASDPRKYMTSWKTARVHATISLMPNWKSESAGWRVFVVISKPLE